MTRLAETLQAHIGVLPPYLQSEVLDFVEFLEKKHRIGEVGDTLTDAFLARVAHSIGDDFPDDI